MRSDSTKGSAAPPMRCQERDSKDPLNALELRFESHLLLTVAPACRRSPLTSHVQRRLTAPFCKTAIFNWILPWARVWNPVLAPGRDNINLDREAAMTLRELPSVCGVSSVPDQRAIGGRRGRPAATPYGRERASDHRANRRSSAVMGLAGH